MRRVLLALAIVGLCSAEAFAVAFPPMLVNPLDGSGVTPTAFAGGTSLTLTGNDPVTTEFPAPPTAGTTQALVLGSPSSQDFALHARISSTLRSEVGFGLRSNGYSGYLLDVNFNAGSFNMIKVTGGSGANMVTQALSPFSQTGTYDMVFSAQGSSLIGTLTDVANPANTWTLTHTDSSYTSGNFGMVLVATAPVDAEHPGSAGVPINGTWSNLDIGAPIPEPGSVAMLIAGALALLGWAGLRRRS
jgi:hypothetical protein